jgi:hypothetical protein
LERREYRNPLTIRSLNIFDEEAIEQGLAKWRRLPRATFFRITQYMLPASAGATAAKVLVCFCVMLFVKFPPWGARKTHVPRGFIGLKYRLIDNKVGDDHRSYAENPMVHALSGQWPFGKSKLDLKQSSLR